ncbi:17043_t:CDS:1, partial [Cetraspora pellucida]
DDQKDDESTWSTDEKKVLKTSFPSTEQEDPSKETLVIKETNVKI